MPGFTKKVLVAPITALQFVGNVIIAGEGPVLCTYQCDGDSMEKLSHTQIFAAANIHGITQCKSCRERKVLAVHGGKSIRIIQLNNNSFDMLSPELCVDDWIWATHWLAEDNTIPDLQREENTVPDLQGSSFTHLPCQEHGSGPQPNTAAIPGYLALALGHNAIALMDWSSGRVVRMVHCQDKCILYSAHFIGDTWSHLVLAAGTVFNQIVLWPASSRPCDTKIKVTEKPCDSKVKVPAESDERSPGAHVQATPESERVKPLHRLAGHQGVIFHITTHLRRHLVCSVSDDRSVRLWRVRSADNSKQHCDWSESTTKPHYDSDWSADGSKPLCDWSIEMWEAAIFEPIHVLFGHKARVWKALLLDSHIISVGEDATCIVWNYDGTVKRKLHGHKGRSIWSVACSEDERLLATGGGDTSIRISPVDSGGLSASWNSLPLQPCPDTGDFPRLVRLLGPDTVLVMTNEGHLRSYSIKTGSWLTLMTDQRFRSYCVMEAIAQHQLIAVGSICGLIKILNSDGSVVAEQQVLSGRVHSLLWLSRQEEATSLHLITTGPDGCIKLLRLVLHSGELLSIGEFVLPATKQRWVSAACIVETGGVGKPEGRAGLTGSVRPVDRDTEEETRKATISEGVNVMATLSEGVDATATSSGRVDVRATSPEGVDGTATKTERVGSAGSTEGNGMLVCGDRGGTVHVYKLSLRSDDTPSPSVQSFARLHGKSGVTDVCFHDNHLYTCGRDGFYRKYQIKDGWLHLLETNRVSKGWDWLARILCTDDGLHILGFHMDQFVVRNLSQSEPSISIPCGGGHRAWDFWPHSPDRATNSSAANWLSDSPEGATSGSTNSPGGVTGCLYDSPRVSDCRFVYIKNTEVMVCSGGLTQASVALEPALHGREVNAVVCVFPEVHATPAPELVSIAATAGEDGHVHLVAITTNHKKHSVCVIATLQGHISSVKALATTGSSQGQGHPVSQGEGHAGHCRQESSRLSSSVLLSGGGRAQLFAWRIWLQTESGGRYHCWPEQLASSSMVEDGGVRRKKTWRTKATVIDPETRVMCLDILPLSNIDPALPTDCYAVAVGCSDAVLRVFILDERLKSLQKITESSYHQHCILCTKFIAMTTANHKRALIVSAGTDGQVALWDITDHIIDCFSESSQSDSSTGKPEKDRVLYSEKNNKFINKQTDCLRNDLGDPLWFEQLHQSGINAMDIKHIKGTEYLLVTSGDDNALCSLNLDLAFTDGKVKVTVINSCKKCDAHATQITGVSLASDDHILSVSIDQRAILWRITDIGLRFVSCSYMNVADISGLATWKSQGADKDQMEAIISGIGLQWFSFSTS